MIDLKAIQDGLNNREFFLEYLPTVSLHNNRCVGCEALIRWRHRTRVIPPLEFIPLIENTLLSGSVTYWVIDTVAHELGAWLREHEDVHISVNVLPGFLGHGGLASAIANSNLLDVIDQLVVEVTERGLTEKTEPDRLHTKGNGRARVALDDSALSESSFVVLSRARVDIVKIDKPFVDRLPANDCAPGALPELARLLRAANHVVIAEGVETAAQADCLRRLGVHLAQGWHFSRALPVSEFLRYFAAHR